MAYDPKKGEIEYKCIMYIILFLFYIHTYFGITGLFFYGEYRCID